MLQTGRFCKTQNPESPAPAAQSGNTDRHARQILACAIRRAASSPARLVLSQQRCPDPTDAQQRRFCFCRRWRAANRSIIVDIRRQIAFRELRDMRAVTGFTRSFKIVRRVTTTVGARTLK